ncbi:MAG TPA: UDP-N-acetylmuramoyl-tripeptide--D-alanyl-D-alanine ligase [Chitinophagaceae bacterium]|nr:UDP-N-acetylmuramoyl-tripeptide--D-alanyl-D-alanine ligase [Chitinophagaceae bacterium]
MNTEDLYRIYQQFPFVQTDTRKLKKAEIFFALKGEHFNGNKFAKQAIEQGAAYAVIDEAAYAIPGKTILVDDVLIGLQQLAQYHRSQLSIPFLAITGSNGKTTTKELIHAVLSEKFKTSTTEGNLNNHIGVPLTLLRISPHAQIAVIEMGANHLREIAGYCEIAQPTHGIITNCGKAHLEGFGSEEVIRQAKGELYDYLRAHQGTAFIMWDYDYLRKMSRGISGTIKYGTNQEAHIYGIAVKSEPWLEVEVQQGLSGGSLHTKLVGDYNLPNVLVAVTVGKFFDVPDNKIRSAIENYVPSNSRSQLLKKGTNTIILDAYNANPSSMQLAIQNFEKMQQQNKVLMLGAMAELGKDSIDEHKRIVEQIGNSKWKAVVLVGGDFLNLKHPYTSFETSEKAAEWLKNQNFENTYLLVKGSRSIKMEKVVEELN